VERVNSFQKWRHRYLSVGMPTIPLQSGAKVPAHKAWQKINSSEQWNDLGSGFRGNIGIRLGEGLAVFDADNSVTVEAVRDHLHGLGIKAPAVKTKRGRHYYLKVRDIPEGFNSSNLKKLKGELRAGAGAYVVAPCSMVQDHRYRFISGTPEQISTNKSIKWGDLRELILAEPLPYKLTQPPVRLVWRDMPSKAGELLRWLMSAHQGERYQKYATRSEAEAGVVAMLILSGWEYEDIFHIFESSQPGHYAEAHKPEPYLALTYANVLTHLGSSPVRSHLALAYKASNDLAWPGRGGAGRQAVAKALLAIGWQWDTYEPQASVRYLAEHGTLSKTGVHRVLKYLKEASLIKQITAGDHQQGSIYEVHGLAYYLEGKSAKGDNSHISIEKGISSKGSALWSRAYLAERSGLGASAGMVFRRLSGSPTNVAVLAAGTGKHGSTVRRALAELERYELAEHVDTTGRAKWYVRGGANVEKVASDLGTEIMAKRLRQHHEIEREIYQSILLRRGVKKGKNKKDLA